MITRLVPCIGCQLDVLQQLDAEGVWRPKPALCDGCREANAEAAARWERETQRREKAAA
jgi:hypothetical protein